MKRVVLNVPPVPSDCSEHIVGIQRWEDASREHVKIEPLVRRRRKIQFDPSLDPYAPANQEAARAYGLRWNQSSGFYEDADGCPKRDRFGQKL